MISALEPAVCQNLLPNLSYEQANSLKNNLSWVRLEQMFVGEAIETWLATCKPITGIAYRYKMKRMLQLGYIHPEMTLQQFSLINHESIIDHIKHDDIPLAEMSRQTAAAAYISFTAFLNRRFGKLIPKALPCREGKDRTFFRVRDKVKTMAMNYNQLMEFLKALEQFNHKHFIMAKVIVQGAKRINEVRSLKVDQINFETCRISFIQLKTEGLLKETIITYPQSVMNDLKSICPPSGYVFCTRTGKMIDYMNIYDDFRKAGEDAGIPFRVTPHVLRATAITEYKKGGCSSDEIMKISGHACVNQVNAYDKTDIAENPSKRFNLV
jgi:integrase